MLVTYEYECTNCGEFYSEDRTISDYRENGPRKKCKNCKKLKLERIISKPLVSKMAEPKTVGSLAEENYRKNKSKIEEEARIRKDERYNNIRERAAKNGVELPKDRPEPKKSPHETKTDAEVNKMTQERKVKYMMEGK